jgi:trehalose 6-phosphate phosphatase
VIGPLSSLRTRRRCTSVVIRDIAKRAESQGLVTHWGRKVLEVRPPVEMHKGKGIQRLLEGSDVRVALYAGDDNTDVDAFRTLRALVADGRLDQAVCVGVRNDEMPSEIEAEADVLADGTAGVRAMLEALAS